jgi:hypothetical protein
LEYRTFTIARRWNGDVFEEPLPEPFTPPTRFDREDDLLTRRASLRRFFAVPVTRRGDVFVDRTQPGRTFVGRSCSSPLFRRCRAEDFMADSRPHLTVFLNSLARPRSQAEKGCRHLTGGDVEIPSQP